MKKMIVLGLMIILVGCAEKKEYEEAVLTELKADKDIEDYKINVEEMTKCVVEKSSSNMPGLFAFDPERLTAYKNYAKMLKLRSSADPKKTLEELRTDFGSAKNLAEAHSIFTESIMNCLEGIITSGERELKK